MMRARVMIHLGLLLNYIASSSKVSVIMMNGRVPSTSVGVYEVRSVVEYYSCEMMY